VNTLGHPADSDWADRRDVEGRLCAEGPADFKIWRGMVAGGSGGLHEQCRKGDG
jgi:hypothetical protein